MKLHRLLLMLLTIEKNGKITANVLAEKLEISKRTIYRDIEILCESGIPIVTETGPNGGISFMPGYQTAIKNLNKEDIIHLYLHCIGLDAASNSELAVKSNLSMLKLEKALKTEDRNEIYTIKNRLYLDNSPWWEESKSMNYIDIIMNSLLNLIKLQISYKGNNKIFSKRTIRPYGLMIKSAEWYLAAFCETRQSLRVFKCERISDCSLINEHYIIPDSFVLSDYFKSNIKAFEANCREIEQYPVKLRIPADTSDILNQYEVYKAMKKGDYIIASINMYSFDRAKSEFWNILHQSVVMEPDELKDYVKGTLTAALEQYQHSIMN